MSDEEQVVPKKSHKGIGGHGKGIVIIIIIIVVILILVGGGIGVYFALKKKSSNGFSNTHHMELSPTAGDDWIGKWFFSAGDGKKQIVVALNKGDGFLTTATCSNNPSKWTKVLKLALDQGPGNTTTPTVSYRGGKLYDTDGTEIETYTFFAGHGINNEPEYSKFRVVSGKGKYGDCSNNSS